MSIYNLLFPTRDLCYLCKEKTPYLIGFTCSDCRDNLVFVHKKINIDLEYISSAIYSLNYNRFLKEVVHGFKFNGKSYLYKPLAEIMLETMELLNISGVDCIFFIPIHRRKEAIRGYNQTQLLANYIGKSLEIPVSKKNLIKIKWTQEQNQLDRIHRLKNLKDSFVIKNPEEIYGKKVLLIDDIITTGATFNECSRLLIKNGAKEVVSLALTSSKII